MGPESPHCSISNLSASYTVMIFLFAFWHSSSKNYSEIKLFSTCLSLHLSFVSPVCFFSLDHDIWGAAVGRINVFIEVDLRFPPVWWAEMCSQLLVPVSVPWPVPRWCDCVGAPHCWKQGITQCCSTLPVDAPGCVADLVSMESSGILPRPASHLPLLCGLESNLGNSSVPWARWSANSFG